MHARWRWPGLGLLLFLILLLPAFLGASPYGEHRPPAEAGPTGCSSCGGHAHMAAPLATDELERLLRTFAELPLDETNLALESLLYHGAQVRAHLRDGAASLVPGKALAFLQRELSRTHAVVSLRIVDEHGVVHSEVVDARVALGEKAHLAASAKGTVRLQPHEFNGSVLRVGVHHLWARY